MRGVRTDVVTVYDAHTLRPVQEIGIPPKRAEYFPGDAANALSDDGRFLAVFNLTPRHVALDRRRGRAPLHRRDASTGLQPGVRRRPASLLHAVRRRLGAHRDRSTRAGSRSRQAGTEPFFDPAADP